MSSTRTTRNRTAAFVAGGLAALSLSLAPSASADPGVDPGAARNDIGPVQRADNGGTPQVDVGRLLNDIDDPAIAPNSGAPGTVPASDTGAGDDNPYLELVLGALAGLAVGAGATVVVSRRGHAHAAGQTA